MAATIMCTRPPTQQNSRICSLLVFTPLCWVRAPIRKHHGHQMPHVSSKALWVSLGVPLLLPGSGTILLVPASQSDRNQAHIVADFSVHFDECF
jgi:hypothetical protein